jgi:flagellar basal-body rod protein FlgC
MVDALSSSISLAASGLFAQSRRMSVASENLANAQATGSTPGADPYARKTIAFEVDTGDAEDVRGVKVVSIDRDQSPFRIQHMPGHPAADGNGNVKTPNVDPLIELADIREANRSYQANLQVIKQARNLISMTIDMLKG